MAFINYKRVACNLQKLLDDDPVSVMKWSEINNDGFHYLTELYEAINTGRILAVEHTDLSALSHFIGE